MCLLCCSVLPSSLRVVMTWTPTMCCPAVSVLAAASRDSPCPPTTAVESAEPLRNCPLRVNVTLIISINQSDNQSITRTCRSQDVIDVFPLYTLVRFAFSALSSLEGEFKGKYYPLGGMTEAEQEQLIADHFLFDKPVSPLLTCAGMARDWPDARGIWWETQSHRIYLGSLCSKSKKFIRYYKKTVKIRVCVSV